MGFMFGIFACLFIITYVIFNHYINIDQIKLPSLETLSSLTGTEEVTSVEMAQSNKNVTTSNAFAALLDKSIPTKKELSFFNFISSSNTQLEFFTLIGIIFNALM
jgi:hypothetical protein